MAATKYTEESIKSLEWHEHIRQPESDIAIPVGKAEISQGVPDLGQNEKENWQRLREERKLARQQILSDIKASAKDEIKNVQEERLQQKAKIVDSAKPW